MNASEAALNVGIAAGPETERLLRALPDLPLDAGTQAELAHALRHGQACGYATILIAPAVAEAVLAAGPGRRISA